MALWMCERHAIGGDDAGAIPVRDAATRAGRGRRASRLRDGSRWRPRRIRREICQESCIVVLSL